MTGWLRARICAARADRDGRGPDAGMTLVELLVAMFVTSILLAGVATVFSGTMRGVRTVNTKTGTTADARIAMEAISRTLRVAIIPTNESSALVTAGPSTLTFYALINRTGSATATPLPSLIEYAWNGTCVTEAQTLGRTLTVPASSGSTLAWDTGRTSKCLARTSIAPVFSYYKADASSGANAFTLIALPPSGLALAARQTVISVRAAITISDANNPDVSGVPVTDQVTLINVQTITGG